MADMPMEGSGRNAASTRALEELEYALRKCQSRFSQNSPRSKRPPHRPSDRGDPGTDDRGAANAQPLNAKGGLLSTIETEIIPRLLLAHTRNTGRPATSTASVKRQPEKPGEEDLAEFTRLILNHEASVGLSFIDSLRRRGVHVDSIFLNLLAPAARRLGEMWESDDTDFVAVTIALGRLQQNLHDLRRAFLDDTVEAAFNPRRRCILTSYAEDQHIFGALMVAEFLRRANWMVVFEPCQSIAATRRSIAEEWFAIAGLSISTEHDIGQLKSEIAEIRRVSNNPDIAVLVGGRLVNENPELVKYVDADATAANADLATVAAENLFAQIY